MVAKGYRSFPRAAQGMWRSSVGSLVPAAVTEKYEHTEEYGQ